MINSDSGLVLLPGPRYFSSHSPLYLPENIAIMDFSFTDQIDVYDLELNMVCSKPAISSLAVLSSSSYGEKIYMARSDGISTWVPDTATSSIHTRNDFDRNGCVEVWPNPSYTGVVNIRSDDEIYQVIVRNISGDIVYRFDSHGARSMTCMLQGHVNGMYILEIETDRMCMVKKILIYK